MIAVRQSDSPSQAEPSSRGVGGPPEGTALVDYRSLRGRECQLVLSVAERSGCATADPALVSCGDEFACPTRTRNLLPAQPTLRSHEKPTWRLCPMRAGRASAPEVRRRTAEPLPNWLIFPALQPYSAAFPMASMPCMPAVIRGLRSVA